MRRRIHNYFIRRLREGVGKGGALEESALGLLSSLYGLAVRCRNQGYDREWFRIRWIPRPTLSVGGLIAGGVGKTPAVMLIAETLLQMGRSPLILLRGYGAPQAPGAPVPVDPFLPGIWKTAGDEASLLARRCPQAVVIAHSDRYRSAAWAVEHLSFDTVLLDDGFQHRRLGRDLDLVCLDAARPLGAGCLLPQGDLREPPQGLRRAGGFLLSRSSEERTSFQKDLLPEAPVMRMVWRLADELTPLAGGPVVSPADLRGKRTGVVAGIGRPHRFQRDIESLGFNIVWSWSLPDHEPLSGRDVETIKAARKKNDVDLILITEKDAVRWEEPLNEIPGVYWVRGSAGWAGDEDRRKFLELFEGALVSFEGRKKQGRPR
ncbi:MAG: tetraacyldisaccharide 4'-kinase [Candidatus Eisenbacteria bacterium]|uniref:Tetraacyldisaccharide 4'-kinase n=1 Tax=Eiseniibacteriota bacterium TaxID=2212470 RepID=A0A948WBS9_UNCEI|nr:tetraacyldisaccharide 4'-kinase [Candidatus Eisenbacteria bacterium]MBU2690263.1 tetraacyldisaccharide 4'-kinase [Candidatus Eisenbacteria bacterium]